MMVEGLRQAVSNGQSLKDAMMSFYNAGYPSQEIEMAARQFQMESQSSQQNKTPITPEKKEIIKKEIPQQINQNKKLPSINQNNLENIKPKNIPKPIQPKISEYKEEDQKKPKGKFWTYFLIFVLIVLLGALATIVLFKDELMGLL